MTTQVSPRLEVLDYDECVRLLAASEVGRLAWAGAHGTALVPVNFGWTGTTVVVRTDPGARLDEVLANPVAFEIDEFVRADHSGWSVVVAGVARAVEAGYADVEPWAPGSKAHWLEIVPAKISGRRVVSVSDPASAPATDTQSELSPVETLENALWRMSAYS